MSRSSRQGVRVALTHELDQLVTRRRMPTGANETGSIRVGARQRVLVDDPVLLLQGPHRQL